MNALALIYRHDGHHLRQIWRTGDIAIFERALSPEHPAHELELVVIREVPDKTMPNGAISFTRVQRAGAKPGGVSRLESGTLCCDWPSFWFRWKRAGQPLSGSRSPSGN